MLNTLGILVFQHITDEIHSHSSALSVAPPSSSSIRPTASLVFASAPCRRSRSSTIAWNVTLMLIRNTISAQRGEATDAAAGGSDDGFVVLIDEEMMNGEGGGDMIKAAGRREGGEEGGVLEGLVEEGGRAGIWRGGGLVDVILLSNIPLSVGTSYMNVISLIKFYLTLEVHLITVYFLTEKYQFVHE